MIRRLIILAFVAMAVTGCATTRQDQTMVTQMQLRIGELEREVQAKEQRIIELEYGMKDMTYDIAQLKKGSGGMRTAQVRRSSEGGSSLKDDDRIIRVDVDPQDVQTALKNAGYYSGAIDGKVGSGTKKAIYSFQQEKGIKADGLVGRETWSELKTYLQ